MRFGQLWSKCRLMVALTVNFEKVTIMLNKITKDTDIDVFPKNYLFDTIEGVEWKERKIIPFDMIEIDPFDNIVRVGGTNPTLINELRDSMSKGINPNECLPVLQELKVPTPYVHPIYGSGVYHYKLVDGHNRCETLMMLGYEEYAFDIAQFGVDGINYELARASFALASNAPRPKVSSSNEDVRNAAAKLVERGLIENTITSIKNWIEKYSQFRGKRASEIANLVGNGTGASDGIALWTPTMIKNDVSKYGINSHGNFDITRTMHGYTCKAGYENETVLMAANKLYETGNPSYVVGHVGIPKDDINDSRMEITATFKHFEKIFDNMFDYRVKHGKYPWEVIGFLPQTKDEQIEKKIVDLK